MSNKHFPPTPVVKGEDARRIQREKREGTPDTPLRVETIRRAVEIFRQNQPLPPRPDVTPAGEPCPCCRATIARPEEERVSRLARWLYHASLRWLGAKPLAYDALPHAAQRQWIEQSREALREIDP